MNRTGIQGFYETSRDRKQKFANQRHKYSDFGVLLDYWFDERARAEAETEIMLYKMSKNQLGFQKLDKYLVTISRPIELTRNLDGFVHHSDIIRLRWTEISSGRLYFLAALPFSVADDGTFEEPCLATATEDSRIMARSAFHVFRNNNLIPNHIPLTYGECILFCTVDGTGHRLLECEPKSFSTYARKSDHREVKWVKELSSRSLWKILHVDKEKRRKTEGKFVKSNTDVILKNLATGQNLAFEKNTSMNTVLGEEKEVSGHLYLDRFKSEEAENVWQLEAPLMGPEDYGGPIHLPRCETL
ncbi:cilia-and flagella-associated protein 161 [Trichonephila clavata]|uniref:Cilia-and flagella-associated protein 161 n=1 Tax=Trichonephila clavata TaxID=2740835 RepID=A0A8X6L2X9_TRICU|nr:cilia-and flagella-associated protein 161 [Trichonephila clavata]